MPKMQKNVHYFCDENEALMLVNLEKMCEDNIWCGGDQCIRCGTQNTENAENIKNTPTSRKRLPVTVFPEDLRALSWKPVPKKADSTIDIRLSFLELFHDLQPMQTESFQRR